MSQRLDRDEAAREAPFSLGKLLKTDLTLDESCAD